MADKLKDEQNKNMPRTPKLNLKNVSKYIVIILLIIFGVPFIYFTLFSDSSEEKEIEAPTKIEKASEGGITKNISDNYGDKEIQDEVDRKLEEKVQEKPLEAQEKIIYVQQEAPPKTEEELFREELRKQRRERAVEARLSGFKRSDKEFINPNVGNGNNSQNPNLDPNFLASLYKQESNDPNMQDKKKKFIAESSVDEFVLRKTLTPTISKYTLKAGSILPVTMWAKVNSDNPGTILAITRENVYDSLTGIKLLIPQGAKLLGQYSSDVAFGQERVQVVFNRLTLPNGKSINLGSMIGSDLEGQSGLRDKVDTHMSRVVGSVLMSAILGAGGAITTSDNNNRNENDWQSQAGQGAGQQIMAVGNRYAEKVLNVQPTLTVRSGFRATILTTQDIVLENYNKDINYIFD
ncbi:type IV secretion system protein VirB10 [Cetobacterium ceti]|uniref:Type IV secretion system protein VirB10 n=1 Tax=Cetobacterium ceti TaxID=180163 RepID=A0A1T4QKS2_9FUSO|nr:TrbI/VirB10 family protein [Cetobacterium ceti]SKA04276.1 type IV secretion system protein VirB10 [Cetobacterium ceti]